ncbi:ferritin-like domain-containing protein [Dongia sp.]|uniref:ferritin-like domain-containing protein n=1 Tax=Dongia sp. TaxID=1977262 RepID=UPI0035B01857
MLDIAQYDPTPYYNWSFPDQGRLQPGGKAHRDAFCRLLTETYNPYKPAVIPWPDLSPAELQRLASLPFWDTAVAIEGRASLRMEWQANRLSDPVIAEALSLNAAEERRHKEVLHNMLTFYRIELGPEPIYLPPNNPEFGFLRTGFGECINSFFAFGLFDLARSSGFFPPALVETFEPVIQEEARHIMFFVNFVAYRRANLGFLRRCLFDAKCLIAIGEQFASRIGMAIETRRRRRKGVRSNFLTDGASAVATGFSKRQFFELCLSENDRRMKGYDARLLRPMMMPRLMRLALRFMK